MNFISVKITQKQLFLGWSMGAYYRLCDHIAFRGRLQHFLKHEDDMPACLRCHQEHTEILASGTTCGLRVLWSSSQALCGVVGTRQNLLCSLGWQRQFRQTGGESYRRRSGFAALKFLILEEAMQKVTPILAQMVCIYCVLAESKHLPGNQDVVHYN